MKKIKEIHNSQFAKKTRELTGLTLQGLGEMLKKVEHEINNNSKKREIGKRQIHIYYILKSKFNA